MSPRLDQQFDLAAVHCRNRPARRRVLWAREVCAGAAAVLLAASPSMGFAAELPVPALVVPAEAQHHVGKVIYLELVTPDREASKQFYSALFGWQFQDVATGGPVYSAASLDGHLVAGFIQRRVPADTHRQPAWLSFIAVRDVDATASDARSHGARVLLEPHDIANRGREAVFADPQGSVFAVLASSSGDPADVLPEPGEWIWSSLLTSDPEADAAFYQDLFDYEVFELPSTPGAQHLLFGSENLARASANTLAPAGAGAHPHWLNYIRVDDAVAMAARVVALGGRVLVDPHPDRAGGKLALVSDSTGAAFGLLEWPETVGNGSAQ